MYFPGALDFRGGIEEVEVIGQIIRADGTVEEPRVVAYWHRSPVKRLFARLRGIKGKARPCV